MNYPLYDVQEVNSFFDFLNIIHDKFGARVAFKSENREWTYAEFCNSVYCCASGLSSHKHTQIVLNIEDSYLFAVAYFAAVISGNIAVLVEKKETGMLSLEEGHICLNSEDVTLLMKTTANINIVSDEESVCTIVCSSGTTSKRRGVMLTQKNLLCDMRGGMQLYEYPEGATYVNIIPYTHLFGIVADLLGPLFSGSIICTVANKMMFFNALKYYKPTHMNLPPILVDAIWKMLLKTGDFTAATGGRLKKIMCAGARLNDEINDDFEKYGLRIYSAYGLTEASPCVAMSRDKAYKKGSVGLILPCCKVEVIDNEIVVTGENVMKGYYNDELSTNDTIRENRLYTGDLGYIDEDGFLFLTGRRTNLIVFEDGTKLMPEELEIAIGMLEPVEECLVQKVVIGNRTFIDIIVVSDDEIDKMNLNSVVNAYVEQGKIHNIIIKKEKLKKNSLGKIIRYMGNKK